jgi:hypothetical protein
MGDYNISCFVSGLSIGFGDLYYIIPLIRNPDYKTGNTPDRQYDLFRPATLPILAKYDNCGDGDVVENNHTKFLEKRFKTTIAKLTNYCNRKYFDNFCYVHKEVYEAMQSYFESCHGKKKDMYDYPQELYKYKLYYRRGIEDAISSIKFYKRLKDDPEIIKEYITENVVKIRNFDFCCSSSDCFSLSFRHLPEIEVLYRVRLLNDWFTDDFIAFIKFNMHLYSVSKQYIPTVFGEQYGNNYMVNALLNASKKIVNDRIKKAREQEKEWKIRYAQIVAERKEKGNKKI